MKIVKTNGKYKIFGDGFESFDNLEPGTYLVDANPDEGFFLTKEKTLKTDVPKVYGRNNKIAEKVSSRFLDEKNTKGIGVALTGYKGSGKTLLAKMISEKMYNSGVPTIIVDQNIKGVFSFLNTIKTPALVLFDEFEKTFQSDQYRGGLDPELLTYLDGVNSSKKMNLLISNSNDVGEFIENRPGRVKVMYEFSGLNSDEVQEYLLDNLAPNVENAEKITCLRTLKDMADNKCEISYDILSAIVSEMNYGEKFEDLMDYINFKPSTRVRVEFSTEGGSGLYEYTYEFKDQTVRVNLYGELGPDSEFVDIYLDMNIHDLFKKGSLEHSDFSFRSKSDSEALKGLKAELIR